MSPNHIDRSNCRFEVKESEQGKVVIVVKLLHDTVPSLKGASLGFDLLGGTSANQARNVVDLLNEYVLDLFVARALP